MQITAVSRKSCTLRGRVPRKHGLHRLHSNSMLTGSGDAQVTCPCHRKPNSFIRRTGKLHSSIMTASFSDLLMIHDFLINTTHSGVGEEQTVCGLKKQEAELLML